MAKQLIEMKLTNDNGTIDFDFVIEYNEQSNTVTIPEGFEQTVASKLETLNSQL